MRGQDISQTVDQSKSSGICRKPVSRSPLGPRCGGDGPSGLDADYATARINNPDSGSGRRVAPGRWYLVTCGESGYVTLQECSAKKG
jgi:hypothetical protein